MKELIPFIAAGVMYLMSPILTRRAKVAIRSWISSEKSNSQVPVGATPYYLSPAHIEDYVEFAADAVQVAPAITLTGVGIILALPDHLATWIAAAITACVSLLLILADAGMYLSRPQKYLRRKVLGLSYVALGGFFLNILGVVVVLLW